MKKILIYGYGNPGRQDDALGILLAQKIDVWAKENKYDNIFTDTNYQLNIEDAYKLNDYDIVIYADASIEDINEHKFHAIKPIMNPKFSMHSVSPEFVLGLCQEIYEKVPEAYLMHIKAYKWEFMAELSEPASKNLEGAFAYLISKIQEMKE
jgi:hydrogenase maturation protease